MRKLAGEGRASFHRKADALRSPFDPKATPMLNIDLWANWLCERVHIREKKGCGTNLAEDDTGHPIG